MSPLSMPITQTLPSVRPKANLSSWEGNIRGVGREIEGKVGREIEEGEWQRWGVRRSGNKAIDDR
jgi:hypothetical protein